MSDTYRWTPVNTTSSLESTDTVLKDKTSLPCFFICHLNNSHLPKQAFKELTYRLEALRSKIALDASEKHDQDETKSLLYQEITPMKDLQLLVVIFKVEVNLKNTLSPALQKETLATIRKLKYLALCCNQNLSFVRILKALVALTFYYIYIN